MRTVGRSLLAAMLAMVVTATTFAAPSRADDPVMHPVTYVITSASPIYADIYYLDQQPAKFSDYSHNPYQYTPNVRADIAPGHPWVSPTVTPAPTGPTRTPTSSAKAGEAITPMTAATNKDFLMSILQELNGGECEARSFVP